MSRILLEVLILVLTVRQSFGVGPAVLANPILSGTINVVVADDKGIIALTDSMVTETSIDEHGVRSSRQRSEPGQKLFRIDDRTVCTIAGFAAADTPPLPDFLNNASAIMGRYQDRLRGMPPSSVADKLQLLEIVFGHYLEGVANIREFTSSGEDYYFQALIAGYDPDGTPEIGGLILRMVSEMGSAGRILRPVTQDRRTVAVLVGQPPVILLAGKTSVAAELLKSQVPWKADEAVSTYEESERLGVPLSTEQMKALAISLKEHTAEADRQVGGPSQVAVLTSGHIQSIEQPPFAPITAVGFKFQIFTRMTLGNAGRTATPIYGIVVQGLFPLYFKNTFTGVRQNLDDSYYAGNVFRECLLSYNGGRIAFEKSNQVLDSDLLLGPNADRNSPNVQELLRNFRWRNVTREMSGSSGVGMFFEQGLPGQR